MGSTTANTKSPVSSQETVRSEQKQQVKGKARSLLPEGFQIVKGLPAVFSQEWTPSHGYPRHILENALSTGESEREIEFIALLDLFLYKNIIARVSRDSIRKWVSWDQWVRIKKRKIALGEWIVEKNSVSFKKEDGKFRSLAAIYSISRSYFRACIFSDDDHGRFRSLSALKNRKKTKQSYFGKLRYIGITEEVTECLEQGTGIKPHINNMFHLIQCTVKYPHRDLPLSMVWGKALRGWRILMPEILRTELRSSWMLGDNNWLYMKGPALQSLPKMIRAVALKGIIDDDSTEEVDFSGCQLNISRILRRQRPLVDPYKEIQTELRKRGYRMDRKRLKKHALAVFGGRTPANYRFLRNMGKEKDFQRDFEAVHRMMKELDYSQENSEARLLQGEIMQRAIRFLVSETGKTGIPLHDSLIVPKNCSTTAETLMRKASRDILGYELPCSRKRFKPEDWRIDYLRTPD